MTPKQREALWDSEVARSKAFGWGELPRCNLCRCPVGIGQAWDVSHDGTPKALGGTAVGVAHRKCNREDGHEVTRTVAKVKRQRRRHIGASGPGRGSRPLPCGRNTRWKAKIGGGVEPRLSQGQRLAQTKRIKQVGKQ